MSFDKYLFARRAKKQRKNIVLSKIEIMSDEDRVL